MLALEFTLILFVCAVLVGLVFEFYRLSLVDQALARATHLGAAAAGRQPATCQNAFTAAFGSDALALWLFDADDSGTIGIVFGAGAAPDGTAAQEVRVELAADDGRIDNGVAFDQANCGAAGSWIRARATVSVRPRFAPGRVLRRHDSWALNQR